MSMMYWALVGLGAFIAIWFLFVVPSERRHHERKLEMLQRKIEKRQSHMNEQESQPSGEQNNEAGDK